MKTIGGAMFVRNGIEFDYCFPQAIQSLCECCDRVVVVDAGSSDGTLGVLHELRNRFSNLNVHALSVTLWDEAKGKEKLAHFQNVAFNLLDTDYNLLVQADEVLHEECYANVRHAVELGDEGFLCKRFNLWGSPYKMLNVEQARKPCSTEVIRLTKKFYRSYDDGENIAAPASIAMIDFIRIYHMGFVRKKEIMKKKIINMQENVFGMDHDKKLDAMEIFDWTAWFSESDLVPIIEPLPRCVQQWASERI